MNTGKYKIIKTVVTMLQESQYSPHFDIMALFTALIMICKVKLWYIILINGYLCNRTRGLRRRKAINAKSGKKRLILAQLHRSCVSLRTVFELPSYDPVEFSLT